MYYGNPLDLSFEVDGHYYRVWDTRKDGASKTAERVNILELMQKYNMTLRCFPTHEVYQTDYREGRPLGEGETIVEVQLKEFPSGKPVIVKRVRHEVFHEPKWGVKVGANQWPNWQKSDFYGTTAEEAIMKAVNHINNKSND